MTRLIEEESEMVSDVVFFKWKIINFSVEDLLEKDLKSPAFKCLSTDFHLEIHRSSDEIQLKLVESGYDDPPIILKCIVGFYLSNVVNKWRPKTFSAPVKGTDVSHAIPLDKIEEDFIADCVLKVGCKLEIKNLKHTLDHQSETQRLGNEETKQGPTTLAENFRNLLEDSRFSDITLKVGEDTFQAHRAILASRSKVFDGMFQSGMKESQESVVEIVDMKPTILKEMLQYVYAGTIGALSMDLAIDLYVGADRYDLQELKGWCKEFILKHVSPGDVCRVAVIADLHSDKDLAKATKRVFKVNSKTIVGDETWKDFGKQNPSLQTDLLESALVSDC